MEYSTIIIGFVAVVVIFIIIKIAISKLIKILVIVLILAGLTVYGFFKFGSANESISFVKIFTEYSVDDMKDLYKNGKMSKTDSIRYECILQPISDDLHSRFSENELNELKNHRLKYAKEVFNSYRNKKSLIKEKFKNRNEPELYTDFEDKVKNLNKK